MKYLSQKTPLLLILMATTFVACKSSGNDGPADVNAITVNDLAANVVTIFSPSGPATDVAGDTAETETYVYYDLDTGSTVADAASSAWDIAFGGTTILANSANGGGIQLVDADYASTQTAPEAGYANDNASWYLYTAEIPNLPPHAILPLEDKTLVVRTADNRYAKVQIVSYYEGNPDTSTEEFASFFTRPAGRYFTFNYTIQNDGSTQLYHEDTFTYYDLDENEIVEDEASSQWDIAFSGTTIMANSEQNGGLQLLNIEYTNLDEAPTSGYTGTTSAWYTYTGEAPTGPTHAILPNDGQTLVVLTPEGKYAKVQILSYYQGNPDVSSEAFINLFTRPAARYYTFNFGIQTDGSTLFE
ncbi:MAG: hypothetical protein ED557_08695 [Balneola sp.]|nr:MAG: hypothetical protein ED557_08695 [Balneola sp.]